MKAPKTLKTAVAMVALSSCVLIIGLASCRIASNRRHAIAEQQKLLRAQVERQQALYARFRRLPSGTISTAFLKEFGKPKSMTPCGNSDRQCWYFDFEGRTMFVCFDENEKATCEGTISYLP
jgi:hypothetical protein